LNRKEELLTVLQEECAEVTQAISKIFRFGEQSHHPKDRKKITNYDHFITELGDILGVIKLLAEDGYLDEEKLMNAAEDKVKKLDKFMVNKNENSSPSR
jgi:NTP pyrophosphatase (non-canonical NTP hydrolase)